MLFSPISGRKSVQAFGRSIDGLAGNHPLVVSARTISFNGPSQIDQLHAVLLLAEKDNIRTFDILVRDFRAVKFLNAYGNLMKRGHVPLEVRPLSAIEK